MKLIGISLALLLLCGCSSLFKSTKDKQVGFDSQVYGGKLTVFDPATGSTAPAGEIGFGSINYRSMPVKPGQPYYARYTVKSFWSDDIASETVIWIGRTTDDAEKLEFEVVPAEMMKISSDGVQSGTFIVREKKRE